MIGPGAVIDASKLLQEIAECKVDVDRLAIDRQAMVIEPRDIKAEGGLKARIGSTGQGVGAASARKIMHRGKHLRLAQDVRELMPFVKDTGALLEIAFAARHRIMLEGTQGTGLSLYHGTYPYVTSRDTTASGCLSEAGISPMRVRKIVMVCRSYPIRVENPTGGTSGPLRDDSLDWKVIADQTGISLDEIRQAERTSTTDRQRRVGFFDWALLRKAASLNGPTDIALTFVDYLNDVNKKARRFEQLDDRTIRLVDEIERVTGAPVSLISTRFDFRSIIDRRNW
jgi:adenylosuccinate synthase